MSDLVERLRNLYLSNGTNYVQEAADRIEELRAENAALRKQLPPEDADLPSWKELAEAWKERAERAEAENAALRERIAEWQGDWQERAEKAEAENAALRADAERYRWLRENIKETPFDMKRFSSEVVPDIRLKYELPPLLSYTCVGSAIPLDAAIDAAKGEKP